MGVMVEHNGYLLAKWGGHVNVWNEDGNLLGRYYIQNPQLWSMGIRGVLNDADEKEKIDKYIEIRLRR